MSEWKRLAVPRGRARRAATTHFDQGILTSAILSKTISRFPFNVAIGWQAGQKERDRENLSAHSLWLPKRPLHAHNGLMVVHVGILIPPWW